MRVLLATESFYPVISGVSIVTQRLAEELSNRGHQVEVIAPATGRFFQAENYKGYKVHYLPSWSNPFRQDHRFLWGGQSAVKEIMQYFKPDVVHIQTPGFLGEAVVREAQLQHCARVVTHHFSWEFVTAYMIGPHSIREKIVKKFLLPRIVHMYNQVQEVVVPSYTMQQQLSAWPLTVPVRVISNGVEYERFAEASLQPELFEHFSLPQDKSWLLYVGRLDPEKTVNLLLEALAFIKDQSLVHLLIIGDGKCRQALQQQASRLGIERRVHWITRIENASPWLPQLYKMASVFCMPSAVETESLVTLDALAAGLPIVAANGGALPELVEEGGNGYLLPPRDPARWGEQLLALLNKPEMRAQMSEKSQQIGKKRSLTQVVTQWEELYEVLIKEEFAAAHPA